MVLSKRERTIAIGVGVAVAALVLNFFVVDPALSALSAAERDRQALEAQLAQEANMLKLSKELGPKWNDRIRTGVKADPADAESQVMHLIVDWARESGVKLTLVKPERLADNKTQLSEIAFDAAGSGSMTSIGKLLLKVRNATVPLKVAELRLASPKEGVDDLTMSLRLSTVYEPGGKRTPQPAPASSTTGAAK